jgi:hypothetical protein
MNRNSLQAGYQFVFECVVPLPALTPQPLVDLIYKLYGLSEDEIKIIENQ